MPAPTRAEVHALSARNRWTGRVTRIRTDAILAEVVLDCGGQEVVAVITRESAEHLGLAEGVEAQAVVKATEVMVER